MQRAPLTQSTPTEGAPALVPGADNGTDSTALKAAPLTRGSPSDIVGTTFIVSAVVLVLVLVAGALLAWVLAGRMLRPLQAINPAAQVAGTASFDQPVGIEGPRNKVRNLSDTSNDMLSRLDRSFLSHRRFAANASHELRAPLPTTQVLLEVALDDPGLPADELRAVSRRVLETNRRNIETVDALLDLADIDRRPLVAEPVDVARPIDRALADAAPELAARDLHVHVSVPHPLIVLGDEVLLRQAVSNLVRNAVRHNVDGGEVRVALSEDSDAMRLRIQNTGPELDADQVTKFTAPFRRGAGRTISATESVRGHGLGLAIVSSVVEAHHRTLALSPREGGGLVVDLSLPQHLTTLPDSATDIGGGRRPHSMRN
ncbi:sensor histidine kinase [Arthrobacter zhaoguopingii]|uniref:sensor histidine kinase n=1 Tax=Arthrobacter zhaoguopingii TaxID=2681491 RepID=UPI001359FF10|nr:HAMP domain-containing sensor histidine kinase [Arthrobacter zhaoguopingii]